MTQEAILGNYRNPSVSNQFQRLDTQSLEFYWGIDESGKLLVLRFKESNE